MLNYKNKILLLSLILVISVGCKNDKFIKYNDSFYSMGSLVDITIFGKNKRDEKLLKECQKLTIELEKKVSVKLENTPISNLNIKKKDTINDDFVLELLSDALYYSEYTKGIFDPTIYSLSNLWGFVKEDYKIPSQKSINENLSKTGYKNIVIDKNIVTLINGASVDLGGIAGGKIVDIIAAYLKKNGIDNFLINDSGDLYISGKYNGERLWKVGITNPFSKNDILGYMELTDCSIVTSGDYERYFTGSDGLVYHHIIDPKTGRPADTGLHSVSVITDKTEKADVLSTSLFVMGSKKGLEFISDKKDIHAIFIEGRVDEYTIFTSSGIIKTKEAQRWKFEIK